MKNKQLIINRMEVLIPNFKEFKDECMELVQCFIDDGLVVDESNIDLIIKMEVIPFVKTLKEHIQIREEIINGLQ